MTHKREGERWEKTNILPTPSYTAVSAGNVAISPRVSCTSRISRCLDTICVRTRPICCCAAAAWDSISLTSWGLGVSGLCLRCGGGKGGC